MNLLEIETTLALFVTHSALYADLQLTHFLAKNYDLLPKSGTAQAYSSPTEIGSDASAYGVCDAMSRLIFFLFDYIQHAYLLQSDHDLRKHKSTLRGTKKLGCPVAIYVYEIVKFTDFSVSD